MEICSFQSVYVNFLMMIHLVLYSIYSYFRRVCVGCFRQFEFHCENRVLPSQMNGRTGTTLKNSSGQRLSLGALAGCGKVTGIYYGC